MTPDRLTSILSTGAGGGGPPSRTADCPDENVVASYVDGTLRPEGASRFEAHLADCSACLALVGFLSRERSTHDFAPVPAASLDRAELRQPDRRHDAQRYAPYLATAAVLFLAVAVLVNVTQRIDSSGASAGGEDVRAVRGSATSTAPLQVLYPRAGTTVPGNRLAFRWTAVPGSQYYEVRVLSDGGDVLADERVTGTQWQPHGALALRPDTDYYVHVDAYLPDDRSVGSEHVPFRVTP